MRSPLPYLLISLMLAASGARADGERAGDFDYYVLSLGWTPTWCALTGDARGDDQCDARHDFGFTLHGLWPQYESGWPSYCRSTMREATRSETAAMADIMGSSGLAWHEWKKHGRCSGLSGSNYFEKARTAYASIMIPNYFFNLPKTVKLPVSIVEDAFLEANPSLERNMITITCDQSRIEEVRICLTRDLDPRPCGEDTIRDCKMKDALMEKVR
jgi:ribonuclease T2